MHSLIFRVFLIVALSMFSYSTFSKTIKANNSYPAIQGYSPVSYFTNNKAEKGSSQFTARYLSRTYFFVSKKQVTLFKLNPAQYIPQFGGTCPYSLALGRQVAIDPTRFKIINNLLYLFHNSKELDALKEWNKKDNEIDLIQRAKGQYVIYEFN